MKKMIKIVDQVKIGTNLVEIELGAEFLSAYMNPDQPVDICVSYIINEVDSDKSKEKRKILCVGINTVFEENFENLKLIGVAHNYHIFEILNVKQND